MLRRSGRLWCRSQNRLLVGSSDGDDGQDESSGKLRREFFKIFFHSANLATAQTLPRAPKTIEEAQKFATDYLGQVYSHVKETIGMQTSRRQVPGSWLDLMVVFLFSVPTTWTRMETINIFKGIIRNAGFGVEGPKHSAQVDLTEAEAAAVATLKKDKCHQLQEGQPLPQRQRGRRHH